MVSGRAEYMDSATTLNALLFCPTPCDTPVSTLDAGALNIGADRPFGNTREASAADADDGAA
jgi:hypothetical protein